MPEQTRMDTEMTRNTTKEYIEGMFDLVWLYQPLWVI